MISGVVAEKTTLTILSQELVFMLSAGYGVEKETDNMKHISYMCN